MPSDRINLWDLVLREEKLEDFVEFVEQSPGFGSSLTLEVGTDGSWTIELFSGQSANNITVKVYKDGSLNIRRARFNDGMHEERIVSF